MKIKSKETWRKKRIKITNIGGEGREGRKKEIIREESMKS